MRWELNISQFSSTRKRGAKAFEITVRRARACYWNCVFAWRVPTTLDMNIMPLEGTFKFAIFNFNFLQLVFGHSASGAVG